MANKNLDGIKKLSGEELERSRKIVLDFIGEKDKRSEKEIKTKTISDKIKQPIGHVARNVDGLLASGKKISPKSQQEALKKKEDIEEKKRKELIKEEKEKQQLVLAELREANVQKIPKSRAPVIKDSNLDVEKRLMQQKIKKKQAKIQKKKLEKVMKKKQKKAMKEAMKKKKQAIKEQKKLEKIKKKEEAKKKRQTEKKKRRLNRKKRINKFKNKIKRSVSALLSCIVKFLRLASRILCFVVFILIMVIILGYGGFSLALINFNLDNSATRAITEYVPVAALVTKIGVVTYYDYKDMEEQIKNYHISQSSTMPNKIELIGEVEEKLVKELIVRNLAKKYNLQIEDEEIEQQFNNTVGQLRIEYDKKNLMGIYYNLGDKRYKKRVIAPQLLSEKVADKIVYDQEINLVALSRIEKIKSMLKREQNFDQIARKYGDEFNAGAYYSIDDVLIQFGQSAADLEVGQFSDTIITRRGYYLIECYGKRDNLLGLKYIFIKAKTLDDYLDEEVIKIKTWNLVD